MKKLFITLSFFFITAYANNSMSGYTESIVESAINKPQLLGWNPFSDPVYDLPHNPYTGEILTLKWSTEIPKFDKDDNHLYGFDQVPDECYKNEFSLAFCYNEIKDICDLDSPSEDCINLIKKCQQNEHCYEPIQKKCYSDDAPIECNDLLKDSETPIVYISLKKGEDLSFKYNLSGDAYDNYCLIRQDYVKDAKGNYIMEKKGNDIKKNIAYMKPFTSKEGIHTIEKKYLQTEGIFKVYPKNGKVCAKPKKDDVIFSIKAIPYEDAEKNIVYIEINGDKKDSWNTTKGGFSLSEVEDYFNNKVYNQAVVKGNFFNDPETYKYQTMTITDDPSVTIPQTKTLEVDHLIEINMTNPSNKEIDNIRRNAFEALRKKAYLDKNKIWDLHSKYWHIVYAINKVRKYWEIKNCFNGSEDDKYDLSNCPDFDPENDDPNATYYLYLRDKNECQASTVKIDKNKAKQITIKTRPKKDNNGNNYIKRHFYVNDKEELSNCHVLFTDDAYPIIPGKDGVTGVGGRAQAIHYPFDDDYYKYIHENTYTTDNFPYYKNHLPYGGIVFAPRGVGESHLSNMMHELGHSFGLTDVAKSSIFRRKDILIINDNKTHFDDINDNKAIYNNEYASTETNLMSWQGIGNRLKHRSTPIACPGGTAVYDGKKEPKKFKFYLELKLSGFGENQWDCIHDCYKDNFDTKNREKYWKEIGECDPEGKDKNIIIPEDDTNQDVLNPYIEEQIKIIKDIDPNEIIISNPKK